MERFFRYQVSPFKLEIADSGFIVHFNLFNNLFITCPGIVNHSVKPDSIIKDSVVSVPPAGNDFMPLELFEDQTPVIIVGGIDPNDTFIFSVRPYLLQKLHELPTKQGFQGIHELFVVRLKGDRLTHKVIHLLDDHFLILVVNYPVIGQVVHINQFTVFTNSLSFLGQHIMKALIVPFPGHHFPSFLGSLEPGYFHFNEFLVSHDLVFLTGNRWKVSKIEQREHPLSFYMLSRIRMKQFTDTQNGISTSADISIRP